MISDSDYGCSLDYDGDMYGVYGLCGFVVRMVVCLWVIEDGL